MNQVIAPDEGMGALHAALWGAGNASAAIEIAPPDAGALEPVPGAGAAAGLELIARIGACIGDVGAELRRQRLAARLAWDDCHPIEIFPSAINAAGTLGDERWQPREGFAWQILLLTVTFGAGATYAVAYQSADPSGALPKNALHDFVPNATSSMASWEPKGKILLPGQQLLFASTGGGITVRGDAVEIAIDKLPAYLM